MNKREIDLTASCQRTRVELLQRKQINVLAESSNVGLFESKARRCFMRVSTCMRLSDPDGKRFAGTITAVVSSCMKFFRAIQAALELFKTYLH